MKFDLITWIMNPRNWWLPLLIIFLVSIGGVTMIGRQTYTDAPPVASFIDQQGEPVFTKEQVESGQEVFHKYALMEYGTMFGDGAYRGPDFTAEALHKVRDFMSEYYLQHENRQQNEVTELVKLQIKQNNYNSTNNAITLNAAQTYAAQQLTLYYSNQAKPSAHDLPFNPLSGIHSGEEIKSLTAFFYWGAWVCGVERPGKSYSYTHNWPYDPEAGNT